MLPALLPLMVNCALGFVHELEALHEQIELQQGQCFAGEALEGHWDGLDLAGVKHVDID
jgi:hypothetical protein